MTVVGIIPARAGSRRLPNKNLALLDGEPLIAWTCDAALCSGVLSAVYVNTDSPAIAAAADRRGVACPQLRPAALATDTADTRSANRFLLEVLAQRGEHYDAVMTLQPTSPLRTADDLRAAWDLFETNAPCAVVSVTRVAPASWLGRITKDGCFDPLAGDDPAYRLNGAVYIHTTDDYLGEHAPRKTVAYVMPPERSVDIDTAEDLRYAEHLLQYHASHRSAG